MISGLSGIVHQRVPGIVQLNVAGVIYRVLTSQNTTNQVPEPGEEVMLLTHLYVREDQLTLYGFAANDELQMFELLLSVNKIGPRVALGILSAATPDELYGALANEDVDFLSRMPGIGKKTASRMILDLKGKLPEPTFDDATALGGASIASTDAEAMEALQALGYTFGEARSALGGVDRIEGQTVEERIFAALQQMGRD